MEAMKLLKKANSEFWKKVKTDAAYAPLVDRIKEVYREHCAPPPPLTAHDRGLFALTGSRIEFETPYFERRRALTASALLALIYPEEPRYLCEAEELLLAISEEYAWALPAHTSGLKEEEEKTFIDLFAAETGLQVTEVGYLLENRLSAETHNRIKAEVKKRVLDPFEKRTYWWENSKSNWAAVCAGNVGACFCHLAPERFEKVLPRIMHVLDCFLASYPEDGTCLEGFSYWHYGFGEFVWFADLLLEFTDGKTNLLADEKVEKIAGYAARSFLAGNAAVSFSDGARSEKAELGLMHYLVNNFPASVRLLPEELMGMPIGNLGWHKLSRLLLSFDPALKNERLPQRDYFLNGAGQAIFNRENYSLAVKAGHNDEPHNHNDVGSFILATKCGQVVCDLGAGLYTKQYFSNDRYSILCNSSRGHAVPIVNGKRQRAGREFEGTLLHDRNTATVEMAGAYGQKGLRLTRKLECLRDAVRLTDSFSVCESFTERFPLLGEPKFFDGYVLVENVKIWYDRRTASPILSTEEHALHAPHGGAASETVYLLDFEIEKKQTSASFLFEILE